MENKRLVPLLNLNINTKTNLKKPIVSQSRELQALNTNDMVHYCHNNKWTQARITLDKNDMPRSYTLLNDTDNVIRRNRHHLIKMDSNSVKIENDNDMDNDVETEPKTRHCTSASEPEEKHERQENANELRETLSYTT